MPTRQTTLWHGRWPALAAAATLALAIAVTFLVRTDPDVPLIATVEYASGPYTVRSTIDLGSTLAADSRVATAGDGRLLLALAGGARVRMDHDTQLTLRGPREVWLHQGRLYIDAGTADDENTLTVLADGASIRDVGTLFAVSLEGDALTIATREGRVQVTLPDAQLDSRAVKGLGERLQFRNLHLTSREPLAFDDASWQWARDAAPAFDAQGGSYHAYLAWAARESGRTLRYAAPAVAMYARQEHLAGSATRNAELASIRDTLRTADLQLLPSESHALLVDFQR